MLLPRSLKGQSKSVVTNDLVRLERLMCRLHVVKPRERRDTYNTTCIQCVQTKRSNHAIIPSSTTSYSSLLCLKVLFRKQIQFLSNNLTSSCSRSQGPMDVCLDHVITLITIFTLCFMTCITITLCSRQDMILLKRVITVQLCCIVLQ